MNEKRIEITEGATGRKVGARLMVCPMCTSETFLCYFPDGVDHLHFQCAWCGVSFCDGCEKPEATT